MKTEKEIRKMIAQHLVNYRVAKTKEQKKKIESNIRLMLRILK